MQLMLVAWDLKHSDQTVESLQDYLKDYAVEAFTGLPGMCLKVWFSNGAQQVWGAVYLWETEHRIDPATLPSKAVELIGYPPTSVGVFHVDAAVEGQSPLLTPYVRA